MAKERDRKKDRDSAFADDSASLRSDLAKWVIAFVFAITGVLGVAAIAVAMFDNAHFASAKDVLSMLLPVMGTWAGTVLAFYFTRDNFESAAKNTAALVKQLTSDEKLRSVPVSEVMIDITKAVTLTLDKPEDQVVVKADIVDAKLEKENKERLPILSQDGRVVYLGHRSLFDRFLVKAAASNQNIAAPSLKDMLADAKFGDMLKNSFETVKRTANLAEAKAMMDRIRDCSDVFVTEDGTRDTKVLGWVTNAIIQQQATV